VRLHCSAPARIDLAGGTLDIWPIYLFHQPAVTVNAAISLRAHVQIESRDDGCVVLVSEDTDERIDAPGPADLDVDRLPLVARLVKHFDARGLTVTTRSDSPVGAGLGGSSAMNVALIAALASWENNPGGRFLPRSSAETTPGVVFPLDDEALLTLAMNVEAQVINVPTGVQDYRPALYGGVSAVELSVTGVRRVALATDIAELDRRLVLAYTGATRNSGINNWEMMKRHIDGEAPVVAAFAEIAAVATRMRHAIEACDWAAAGVHLAAEWDNRKRLAPRVTTPVIDALLARAISAGAVAGKVCGAGGGGCLFCLVDPARRDAVVSALTAGGATVLPCSIEREGVRLNRS
jgi:D-glycero-alpha-D-manno-heptose-7-phosphate kinase